MKRLEELLQYKFNNKKLPKTLDIKNIAGFPNFLAYMATISLFNALSTKTIPHSKIIIDETFFVKISKLTKPSPINPHAAIVRSNVLLIPSILTLLYFAHQYINEVDTVLFLFYIHKVQPEYHYFYL